MWQSSGWPCWQVVYLDSAKVGGWPFQPAHPFSPAHHPQSCRIFCCLFFLLLTKICVKELSMWLCQFDGTVVQSFSCVQLFATPWTAAHQASLSFTISQSLLKLMFIELVMLSNHFILCCLLLLLPSTFPSIRVFSSELALGIRSPKY